MEIGKTTTTIETEITHEGKMYIREIEHILDINGNEIDYNLIWYKEKNGMFVSFDDYKELEKIFNDYDNG